MANDTKKAPETPKKEVAPEDDSGMTLCVATEKGYDSARGVTIQPDEQFYLDAKLAARGGSWFEVVKRTPAAPLA